MRGKGTAGVGFLTLAFLLIAVLGPDLREIRAAEPAVPRVNQVEVRVEFEEDGFQPGLADQVAYSLKTVGESLLLGQKVQDVKQLQPLLEKTVHEVFSRALGGFRVQQVRLVPGEVCELVVRLVPNSPVIREVELDVAVEGLNSRVRTMVQGEAAKIGEEVRTLFVGMPVSSLGWSRFAIEPLIIQGARLLLPGFRVAVTGEYGERTTLRIKLTPEGTVVRDARVVVHSYDLPGIAVSFLQSRLEQEGQILVGIPVATLQKYQKEIENLIDAKSQEELGRYGLRVKSALQTGEDTRVSLEVSSERLQLETKGILAIGSDAPDPVIRGKAGWLFASRLAGWGQMDLQTTNLHPVYTAGLSYEMPPVTTLSAGWPLNRPDANQPAYSLRHWLSPRQVVQVEWGARNLWSFGVRMNDFVIVELAGDDHNTIWLQVVGNL